MTGKLELEVRGRGGKKLQAEMSSFQKLKSRLYHVQTIWLFTRSDLKTIVGPSTFFAIVCAIAAPAAFACDPLPSLVIAERIPQTVLWVWCNLLPFTIDNQRQAKSIEEDGINKPWRPLPSKRLSASQATRLMLFFYILALVISSYFGGLAQCVLLVGLGCWYNDLNGADSFCLVRNFINACGYMCFTSGALEVILGQSIYNLADTAYQWFLILGLVIFTTIQAQDMGDQEGDQLRLRWTVPLVIGDMSARYTIAAFVAIWSYICASFWKVHFETHIASITLGLVVGGRFLFNRTARGDKISFYVYNLWITFVFSLPLLRL